MDIYKPKDEVILGQNISYTRQEGEEYLGLAEAALIIDECKKKLLPVIPLFIAEHIERSVSRKLSLVDTLNEASSFDDVQAWLMKHVNQDMFAKAWAVGYAVEREPRYEVVKDECSFNGWLSTDSLHPEWTLGEGALFHKKDAVNLAKLVGGEVRSLEDLEASFSMPRDYRVESILSKPYRKVRL